MAKIKKASKTSIKVKNKSQNKLNKSKKNNKNLKKIKKIRNGIKSNDNLVELQDKKLFTTKNVYHDDEDLDELAVNKNRRVKKRKQYDSDESDTIEANYQTKNSYIKNTNEKNKKIALALPIKTQSGLLLKNIQTIKEDEEEKTEVKEYKKEPLKEQKVVEPVAEEPKSVIDLIREKKELLDKTKAKIAVLSKAVIENPEKEMKKLKELRQMLTNPDIRSSFILKKLIVVSLCEIFKDIIPSYKIRSWTEKENEQKIGKEVQELKEYEETLLKQYKLYIDYLNDSIKGVYKILREQDRESPKLSEESVKSFAFICVRSLSQILEKLSHFNYTNDLIEIIINQTTSKLPELSQIALETIQNLFKNDKSLHLSLEIMQKLAKMLKQKSFGVKPEILDLFLHLKLKEIKKFEEEDKSKKLTHKEKMKLSRSERKKLKEKEQLETELEEKKLSDRLKEKSRLQARILEQIFMIYFRILKKAPNFKLFPSVLEGLSKFAHLINLDFFEDLLKLMHEMIESDRLTFRSKLHCIKTIFIVLSGQGEALTIDPMKFYTSLYNIILQLNAAGNLDNVYLLADCIDMMFLKRRKQIPTPRLLAFIKRLSILSLQLDAASSAVILNILRKLINMNKSSDLLFDNEYQDSGIYNPELTEPDYSNAQNSALWELHLMRRHYNKLISDNAVDLLKQTNLSLAESKMSVDEIFKIMNEYDETCLKEKLDLKKFKK